ncbi:MAG: DNA-directed RNA polymerase subunit L [Thermoproteota archaeon]|nr:DNA-directed RNA polymerase subunit L [Thermoproteota archaeon]
MRVKVLKRSSNELELEIEGETHTFCNLLQKTLLEDDGVEMGGYTLPHPLVASPVVYVRTKGRRNPSVALQRAVKNMRKRIESFQVAFESALDKWSGSS